ncbi:choice-of-anchor D domain-containing protein [Silvanigrella paludirubra]|uniref:Choice-of-anchor D domain-containing protein n=1 Tax=Silvanigrella paludirubra TaxID=2499159 RepID=A0A6N6VN90_9BACT|nr:choice-of-anchor D domain-containing protein [Silvanigrella paludirubra]KAB8036454.1 choice-of-anchor D domain-containing protein [Silvanigrella paludirubra]
MTIRNSKLIQLSLITLVGASFAISCNKGSSSNSASEQSPEVNPAQDQQPNLTVTMSVPQVVAKVGDKKEQVLVIKNEGSKSAQNITITGVEGGLITIKSETPAVVDPAKPVEPAKAAKSEATTPVVDPAPVVDPVADTSCLNKTLAAGETCQVTIVFAPTEVASGKETISVAYSSESASATKTTAFDVNYLAKGEVTLDIPTLAQLKAEVSKTDKKTLTITNKSANAITGIKIADLASPLSITGNTCKETLEKGQSCDIEVTFAPADLMDTKQNLQITYNDVDEEGNLVPVTIPSVISYQTIGKADLSLNSYADFLVSNINKDSAIRTYTIKNNGNGKATLVTLPTLVKPLSIKLDSSTCKPVDGKSFELAKDASCTFDVSLNSDKIDEQKEVAMVVTYNDGTTKKSAITTINYKTVAANVLNLSQYKVNSKSIQIDTSCNKKEIYGNGKHNIPLVPTFTATDDSGKAISVKLEDVVASTQVQLVSGGISSDATSILSAANNFTKCTEGSSIPSNTQAKFIYTEANGQKLDVGAKISYVEKDGTVTTISTEDNQAGRVNLAVLANPLKGVDTGSLFTFGIVADGYSGDLVTRDNYRLFKISPDVKTYATLSSSEVSQIRVTNKNMNRSSALIGVDFKGGYSIDLGWFDQGERKTFLNNQYRREFYSGKFLSGKLKPDSVTYVTLSKNKNQDLTLTSIGKNDYAFASISDSGMPSWVGNYQWHLPFMLEMNGVDSFGNPFYAQLNDNM